MKRYGQEHIRNVGIFSHGGEGKTSIAEVMLFLSGENSRIGRVDDGTSLLDYEEEEKERKTTISSSLATFEWGGCKINLLDTPGDDNFIFDAKLCMRVVEGAIIVVSAVSGVRVQTEKVWEYAKEFSVPCLLFINKLDRERADFERTLEEVGKNLGGAQFVPIALPIGEEEHLRGVVDLLDMKAHIYKDDGLGTYEEAPIEEGLQTQAKAARERLVESVVELDDELMERYLGGEEIRIEEIERVLKKGVEERKIVPVLCGSAAKAIGIDLILNTIVRFFPPPGFARAISGIDPRNGSPIERDMSPERPLAAFVFKTISDPFAGKLSLFRVYSGEMHPDMTVLNATNLEKEKIGQIFYLVGKKQKPVGYVSVGDIAVLAKLREVRTNDTLCDEREPIRLSTVTPPNPVLSYSLKPKTKGDEDRLNASLSKLMEEDLTIRYERDEQTKEFILSGMGQVHIEVIAERLKRKFGVEVELREPKVPYKETIKGTARVQGKYKRQSGGRGQYGDTWLELSPLPRGAGFEFVDKIVGGVIPKQYIPAVEKGIIEAMEHGVLAGFPVTDVKVTLYDGSYHEVDSSDMAFKIAASIGFKKGMEMSNPVILEPIMKMEVVCPEESMGDVIGDLNARRGKIVGVEAKGSNQIIRALVPMAEILRYAPDLRSMTGGRGTFTIEFSHYEEVPAHLAQKIIEEARKERGQEER